MGTTAHKAYHSIRQMMMDREFIPGQRVSQSKLARKLGCSTVPVVEAMRRLESDGLLVKEPRKMAKVRTLSARERKGLFLLRESLEGIAARLCAEKITAEQVETLNDLNQQYENCAEQNPDNSEMALRTVTAIHHFIAECAECSIVGDEIKRLVLVELTAREGKVNHNPIGRPRSHRAVIQAIADHDTDSAEYLMKKHIRDGYYETVEEFGLSH